VALFFSVDNVDKIENQDYSIIAYNYRDSNKKLLKLLSEKYKSTVDYAQSMELQDQLFDEILQKVKEPIIMITETNITNIRLHLQKGTFMTSNIIDHPLEEVLKEWIKTNPDYLQRIEYSKNITKDIFKLLDKINISYSQLFLSLEGYSKDIYRKLVINALK
jgi:hypothetical protein